MIDGNLLIEKLLLFASKNLFLNEVDVVYKRNILLAAFKLDTPFAEKLSSEVRRSIEEMSVPDELYNEVSQYALENFNCLSDDANRFSVNIFSELSPLPSTIVQTFKKLRELRGAHVACEYLYNLSMMNNYIKKSLFERNEDWAFEGEFSVELSINELRKEIVNGDNNASIGYPKCLICHENQGYLGGLNYPARANLICTNVELAKENWYLQYSPFAYFKEHCLVVDEKHTPMCVDSKTIDRQFDFIEYIPEYFVVSNADLPNINGVISGHNHFYGGNKYMPIFGAKRLIDFHSQDYPDVEICLVDWPIATIRLYGFNRNTIKEVFSELVEKWKVYQDPDGVILNGEKDRHNSCSVISRFLPDGKYCCEIVFRNNALSEDGKNLIFGIPSKYLSIKNENLGAMEVMGLFILSAKLKTAINVISEYLGDKNRVKANDYGDESIFEEHKEMIEDLLERYGSFKDSTRAETAIKDYIGAAAIEILKNASVFKFDDEGILSIRKFLATISIK